MPKIEDKQFIKHSLDALCFRAREAIFVEKGVTGSQNFQFDVPDNFIRGDLGEVAKKYRHKKPGCHVLKIKPLSKMPDIEFLKLLKRDEMFSYYIPKHRSVAVKLLYLLNDIKDIKELIGHLVYLHDICNPYLYHYVLTVIILHWHEDLDVILPDQFQLFPEQFINGGSYNKAMEVAIVEPASVRSSITVDDHFTADARDPEQWLSYFREDISLNLYHVIYHQIYPSDGPLDIIAKPKRGEIYFYFYRQILAQYNFARMSLGMSRVKRLNNFYEPIPEVCFQKLNSRTANRNWPGRFGYSTLSDIDREVEGLTCDLSDLERWRDRIIEAIDSGYVVKPDGGKFSLINREGIECLGNAIQSSFTSPHYKYYGDLAVLGLVCLGFIHDPVNKHRECFGVIADPATCLRDPVFYRWYSLIDDILQSHKETLPKYTPQDLDYPGICIKDLDVITEVKNDNLKNKFITFYEFLEADLTRGMDFTPRETVYAKIRQIQHKPFFYKILIKSSNKASCKGTVRIFILPKNNERDEPFIFNEQRLLAVELDKFVVTLNPGDNSIKRRSEDASVTQWFCDESDYFKRSNKKPNKAGLGVFGWPQNLLIPRGDADGFPCELFAMVTPDMSSGFSKDELALGFPFDRPSSDNLDFLCRFTQGYDNMTKQNVEIIFQGEDDLPKNKS